MTLKNELVALGKALMSSREMLEQEGVAVATERVLMERGTYPKIWKIS
jgi:H/ACA ribonucleoprotein complex subunit 4